MKTKEPAMQNQTIVTAVIPQEMRTRCEVWTRVMGYHRPVSQFNQGKQSEHRERLHFREQPALVAGRRAA